MFDSVLPAGSEPISAASSRWLWAVRCFALICTITLAVGFVAEGAANGIMLALIFFCRWGSLSLAVLYLLFRKGKNSLAFAFGLSAATAFIALLPFACVLLGSRHLAFFVVVFSGILPPFTYMTGESSRQLAALGTVLLWLFSISLAMLALSSIVAFRKMAHEAQEMGTLRLACRGGMCCALVVCLIFTLVGLFFGGFSI